MNDDQVREMRILRHYAALQDRCGGGRTHVYQFIKRPFEVSTRAWEPIRFAFNRVRATWEAFE